MMFHQGCVPNWLYGMVSTKVPLKEKVVVLDANSMTPKRSSLPSAQS